MIGLNAANERVKRRFFERLADADGLAETTINAIGRSIAAYEIFTEGKDFHKFSGHDALRYKRHLLAGDGRRSVSLSSRSTLRSRLAHLNRFFRWLSGQPGYRKSVRLDQVDYFALPRRDEKISESAAQRSTPSLEQAQHVIRQMPAETAVQRRDQALISLFLLTGVRVSAAISLRLKHVRSDGEGIDQDAREVRTKLGKSSTVYFFPVGEDIKAIFLDYVTFLRNELLWGEEDPLFPQLRRDFDRGAGVQVFERKPWATPNTVWDIFRSAFKAAGIPYHTPHSFRRTLVRLGQRECHTPELMKAWSQNLSHDEVMTTLTSYGHVPLHRQAELLRSMPSRKSVSDEHEYERLLRDPFIRSLLSRLMAHRKEE